MSTFTYQTVGGQDQLRSVRITDGRPRTATFETDIGGEVIRRDEQDGDFGAGDPHEVWYRFGGRTMGYLGNNRSLETDHMTSLNMRVETPGAGGAFRNGQTSGGAVADFDQGLAPLNSYGQGSARGSYTVRAGDTLASIAAGLWGDASLWWKLAEANGLSAGAALMDGQRLTIPAGVIKNTYSAATFAPYDPAAALGDTAPTNPAAPVNPKPGKKGCGVIGTIIMVVVAVVVTIWTAGAAAGALGALASGGSVVGGALAGGAAAFGAGGLAAAVGTGMALTTTGSIVVGAIGAAAGSIVSQFAGMMMGIQEKFSWNAVATAGIGSLAGSAFGAMFGPGVASSALGNAATQVLSPGPNKFSWASVAAAALGSKIPNGMGPASLGTTTARALVDATSQSIIEGTDFDLALRNALPRVIGQTIGQAIAGGLSQNRELTADERAARRYGPGAVHMAQNEHGASGPQENKTQTSESSQETVAVVGKRNWWDPFVETGSRMLGTVGFMSGVGAGFVVDTFKGINALADYVVRDVGGSILYPLQEGINWLLPGKQTNIYRQSYVDFINAGETTVNLLERLGDPAELARDIATVFSEETARSNAHENAFMRGFTNPGWKVATFVATSQLAVTKGKALTTLGQVGKATRTAEMAVAAKGLNTADFPTIGTTVSQKQLRHIAGRPELAARNGGGYLNSVDDAQAV